MNSIVEVLSIVFFINYILTKFNKIILNVLNNYLIYFFMKSVFVYLFILHSHDTNPADTKRYDLFPCYDISCHKITAVLYHVFNV